MRKTCIILVVVFLLSLAPLTAVAETDYTPQAETLKQLGLFLGTDAGFELNRSATRAEAAVMTVRLLGKEADALSNKYAHPFTDVPGWANPYIGYLYHNKIASGISDSQFGSNQTATSAQYATFVLRALGYSDAAGDFSWDKALGKMASLGILTNGQASNFSSNGLRGYFVAISHISLFANLKGENTTLLEKLYLSDKAITQDQLITASINDARISMFSNINGIPKPYPAGGTLTPEEVFAKSSDAVFMLETKILADSDYSSGSGFFITSDGIAVTNRHVIDFMSSASITTTDGKKYPVEGVLALEPDADIAIIKVRGSGFPYLELGDPAALRSAQRIYCVGSPYGFDNTISDGLVSNPNREFEGRRYIQISAPIAPGSSGGALLNEYGQVVGVTTLGFDQGSVNLAVKITDLADSFWFPQMRSVKYLQAHSQFGAIPVTDVTYTMIGSNAGKPTQVMSNDTIMYGSIKSAGDVHYYSLDVKEEAEMIVSLTSNEISSANLRFEISDPAGNVILNSRHYKGEEFSIATGHAASKGLYTVKIYVGDNGGDWDDVDYELFWLYHKANSDMDFSAIFMEFEPNNTPEYANYLPNNFAYISSISTKNDVDYYSFTLTSRSRYFAYIGIDSEKSILNAEVLDSNNKSVGKFSFDEDGFEYINLQLSAGTYYIRVSVKNTGMLWDNEQYLIAGGVID